MMHRAARMMQHGCKIAPDELFPLKQPQKHSLAILESPKKNSQHHSAGAGLNLGAGELRLEARAEASEKRSSAWYRNFSKDHVAPMKVAGYIHEERMGRQVVGLHFPGMMGSVAQ